MKWIIEHWIPLAVLAVYLIGVAVLLHGFYTANHDNTGDELPNIHDQYEEH